MATTTHHPTSTAITNPAYQAFLALRAGFVVAPMLFGLDRLANLLLGDHYDIALQDLGLLLGALALARLATGFQPARDAAKV